MKSLISLFRLFFFLFFSSSSSFFFVLFISDDEWLPVNLDEGHLAFYYLVLAALMILTLVSRLAAHIKNFDIVIAILFYYSVIVAVVCVISFGFGTFLTTTSTRLRTSC